MEIFNVFVEKTPRTPSSTTVAKIGPSKTGILSGVKLEKMNLYQFPACVPWHFSAGMFASQHSGAKGHFALPNTAI